MPPSRIEVCLEQTDKKVFASALAWPGWCRSGKTDELALERLAEYAGRYSPVLSRAKLALPKRFEFDVVERMPGNATTAFGAPGIPAKSESGRLTAAQAKRIAALVVAAWDALDDVVAGAPASLRKGPRGGGRDRDKMVEHVLEAERAYIRTIGIRLPPAATKDAAGIKQMRAETAEAIASSRGGPPPGGKGWPVAYAARRIAWHVLDHAWEMEDRSS